MVTDIPAPNIWVMDPATESDDTVRGMPRNYLDVVRSIPDIEWAVPAKLNQSTPGHTMGYFSNLRALWNR